MAYCDAAAVMSRAGVLADRWTVDSTPGIGDLESYIRQEAAKLDATIAGKGYDVPLAGAAAAALEGLNADLALLVAIANSFPGSSQVASSVERIYEATAARAKEGIDGLRDGSSPVLAMLSQTTDQGAQATSFWLEEPWYGLTWPFGAPEVWPNVYNDPAVHRGDMF